MRKLLDKEIGKILTDLILCLEEDQYKKAYKVLKYLCDSMEANKVIAEIPEEGIITSLNMKLIETLKPLAYKRIEKYLENYI